MMMRKPVGLGYRSEPEKVVFFNLIMSEKMLIVLFIYVITYLLTNDILIYVHNDENCKSYCLSLCMPMDVYKGVRKLFNR